MKFKNLAFYKKTIINKIYNKINDIFYTIVIFIL